MMLLRAHCEMKQGRHVHDTAENRYNSGLHVCRISMLYSDLVFQVRVLESVPRRQHDLYESEKIADKLVRPSSETQGVERRLQSNSPRHDATDSIVESRELAAFVVEPSHGRFG